MHCSTTPPAPPLLHCSLLQATALCCTPALHCSYHVFCTFAIFSMCEIASVVYDIFCAAIALAIFKHSPPTTSTTLHSSIVLQLHYPCDVFCIFVSHCSMDPFVIQPPCGPQKSSLLKGHHVLATTRKSCAKKKVPVSKINISLLKFSGIFCDKMHFWPKDHFSAKHKNIRFSIIPARIRSFVIVGHFLDDLDVSTKFC